MWRIAICDSDAEFSSVFGDVVKEFFQKRGFDVELKLYSTGAEFASETEEAKLVFINTRLSDMKGFALAELLAVRKSRALLVFLGDNDEDVFEAFRYHPFRYMRKPKWRSEAGDILEALWQEEHRNRSILIRQKRGDLLIPLDNIVYMESRGHYVHIHCVDGDYQIRQKLTFYEELLQGRYFVHPSKSFLVNCAHIESLGAEVLLKNGEQLNCSKSRRRAAEQLHQQYLEESAHSL